MNMKEKILELVRSHNSSLNDASNYLMDLKDSNKSRQDVYDTLEGLRSEVTEEEEDFILEIMDIVSGWCLTDKEIW